MAPATRFRTRDLLGAAVLALLAACASSRPPPDLAPPDLFEWAQTRFDEGDYGRAERGFQDFLLRDPLNPLTDSAQYLMAEAMLRDHRELEAAQEFGRFATSRPGSDLADDAQFGACRAYWAASPKVALSQEFTLRSLEECERLLQFFPGTTLREDAEALMALAQAKLARKAFEIGKHYYDDKLYQSANVYFEIAMSRSPSPDLLPDLLATMYWSYSRLGFESEARVVLDRLLREFPESEQADDLRDEREDGPAAAGDGGGGG